MNWLDKLERKFGRYAIRNLPLYIVMLYAIGAVLNILTKGSYYYYVALNPYMILHGQKSLTLIQKANMIILPIT